MIKIKRILLLFTCIISIGIMQAYAVGSSSTNDTIGQKEAASSLDSVLLIEDDSVAAETYDPLCNEIEGEKCTWWKKNFGVQADNNSDVTKMQLYINDILAISAIGLCVLAFICVVIVGLIIYSKNDIWKIITEHVMQILLIVIIAFIAIYSDSHWAYLALVVLCVLGIFKYNNKLFEKFKDILKNIYGHIDKEKLTGEEINNRILQKINRTNENLDDAVELDSLVFNKLAKWYPDVQRYIKIKNASHAYYELDGLIEKLNINYVVEIKHYHQNLDRNNFQHIQPVIDYITDKTGKPTILLLFIVTSNLDEKQKVITHYNDDNYVISNFPLYVKVFTKNELETLTKTNAPTP